jgi:hypothetical protein
MRVNVCGAPLAHKRTPSFIAYAPAALHLLVMRHGSWRGRAAPPCTCAPSWRSKLPHMGCHSDPARPERPQGPRNPGARAAARRLPGACGSWLERPAHRCLRITPTHRSPARPERCPRRNTPCARGVRVASIIRVAHGYTLFNLKPFVLVPHNALRLTCGRPIWPPHNLNSSLSVPTAPAVAGHSAFGAPGSVQPLDVSKKCPQGVACP